MAKFEEEKGKLAEPVKLPPRHELIQVARYNRVQMLPTDPNELKTLQSFSGIPNSFSSTPLSQLRFIAFKDLYLRRVQKGRYIITRIISHPYRQVGVSCIVEDPAGDALMLSIYNAPVGQHYNGNELDLLYPPASIIAIREPNLKVPMMGGAGILRVDSPADVSLLSPSDPLLKNVKWRQPAPISPFARNCDFKVGGNLYFVKGEYLVAESLYSRGLRENPPKEQRLLHLNRAAAHLQLSNFASAGRDATAVLEAIKEMDEPESKENLKLREKALFRLANSQYGQRKFLLAKSTFTTLLQHVPTGQQAVDGIAKCEAREKESATGEYDFLGMYQAGKKGGAVRLDVADYHGPIKVEQIAARGGGRGVVATRDIKAGEVVLAEKAFDICFAGDLNPKCFITTLDILRKEVKFNTGVAHVAGIVSKLMDDPSLIPVLDSLYAGPTESPPLPFPVTTDVASSLDSIGIDVGRVELVCTINDFNPESLDPDSGSESAASLPATKLRTIGDPSSSSALFITASFFNHSCQSNVLWKGYGDVLVFRATRDISAGEELLSTYITGATSYEHREKVLATHFDGRGCDCVLCKADRGEGEARRERRAILTSKGGEDQLGRKRETAHRLGTTRAGKKLVEEIKHHIHSIETTYSTRAENLRLDLFGPYHLLAEELRFPYSGSPISISASVEARFSSFKHIGVVVLDKVNLATLETIDFSRSTFGHFAALLALNCIAIAGVYSLMGKDPKAKAWMLAAIRVEEIVSGGGKALFRALHEEDIQKFPFTQQVLALVR